MKTIDSDGNIVSKPMFFPMVVPLYSTERLEQLEDFETRRVLAALADMLRTEKNEEDYRIENISENVKWAKKIDPKYQVVYAAEYSEQPFALMLVEGEAVVSFLNVEDLKENRQLIKLHKDYRIDSEGVETIRGMPIKI